MKNQRNLGKGTLLLSLLALFAIGGVTTIGVTNASTIDTPDPVLERDAINATEGATVQMTVRADDTLPANGSVVMSMEGMNDVDFKDFVPEGRAVIITNDTAEVCDGNSTSCPIGGGAAAPAPQAAAPAPAPAVTTAEEPAAEEESSSEEDEE